MTTLRENDLMVDAEGAEHMRRFAIGESVEALPEGLSVDGDEAGRGVRAGAVEAFRMTTERFLELVRIELPQDAAHRGVGRHPMQRRVRKRRVEQGKPGADQSVNLPIRPSAAQHGEDREQDDADLVVNLPSARRRSGMAARQDARSIVVTGQPPIRVTPHRFRHLLD